ncbi:hypothetical protein C9F11_40725 [Streptomyces sp. YIM 121038]|uniref:hypothetical protein n=1 Tax=Streptomyces sp. YIM 121038 TaxID=2136401 RepID=UPI001110F3D0|nr:hypothetical protein [Streptomyces sp. YIM 121038]QCX81725.1 hypothetical protein C9F11_40725 [Streptomyces sp. YIM 121038]
MRDTRETRGKAGDGEAPPWWDVAFDAHGDAVDERQGDRVAGAAREADVRHLVVLAHTAHQEPELTERVDARCRALFAQAEVTDGVGLVGVRWPGMCFAPPEDGRAGRLTDTDVAGLRRVFPDGGDTLTKLLGLLDERPLRNGALDDVGIALRRLVEQPLDTPLHAYGTDLGANVLPQTDPAMLIDSPTQVCEGFAEALDAARQEVERVENRSPERFEEAHTGSGAPEVSEHGTLTESGTAGPRPADDPTERLSRPESLAPSERPLRDPHAERMPGRVWDGAHQLLCEVTSYAMRRHAGLIGERALAPLLRTLGESLPDTRIHLVGHGAGARLVAYAVRGLGPDERVASLCLFQAALSHFAFAEHLPQLSGGGALAGLHRRVTGPVVCCYSHHDLELGLFFPLACRRIGDGALLSGAGRTWGALSYDGIQGIDGSPALTLADALTEGALPSSGYVGVDASERIRAGGPPRGAHDDVFHQDLVRLVGAAAGLA